jgi:hypothetical protein
VGGAAGAAGAAGARVIHDQVSQDNPRLSATSGIRRTAQPLLRQPGCPETVGWVVEVLTAFDQPNSTAATAGDLPALAAREGRRSAEQSSALQHVDPFFVILAASATCFLAAVTLPTNGDDLFTCTATGAPLSSAPSPGSRRSPTTGSNNPYGVYHDRKEVPIVDLDFKGEASYSREIAVYKRPFMLPLRGGGRLVCIS